MWCLLNAYHDQMSPKQLLVMKVKYTPFLKHLTCEVYWKCSNKEHFVAYGWVLFGDGGWTGGPSQHPTPKIHVACSPVEHFIISDVKRWGNLHNFILLFSTTVSISLLYRKAAVSFLALVLMAKQPMVKWSGMVLGMSSYQFMKQCTLSRWTECLKLWA